MAKDTSNISNWIIALLAVCLIILSGIVAWRSTANSNANTNVNTINVNGDATMQMQPDRADVVLTVQTEYPSALYSQTENANISNNVRNAILALGLNSSDISTSSYSVSINNHYDNNGNLTGITYVTANSIDIELGGSMINDTGSVIDSAVGAGANSVQSVTFSLSDAKQKEAQAELLIEATQAARDKANEIANESGTTIIGVSQISESYVVVNPNTVFDLSGAAVAPTAQPTPISPGQLTVSASVSASYKIE